MNKNNRTQINCQQPLKFSIIFLIRGYQYLVSPLLGPCCRFYPSCSNYAIEAIRTLGCFHGFYLTLKRILCCHPFGKSGYDPVPEKKSHANK